MKFECVFSDSGFDKQTKRFWSMFYVSFNGNIFFVQTSCSKINTIGDMEDFTIEFLDASALNQIEIGYNRIMFEELEQTSFEVFFNMIEGKEII